MCVFVWLCCAFVSQIFCCHDYLLNTTIPLSCQSEAGTDAWFVFGNQCPFTVLCFSLFFKDLCSILGSWFICCVPSRLMWKKLRFPWEISSIIFYNIPIISLEGLNMSLYYSRLLNSEFIEFLSLPIALPWWQFNTPRGQAMQLIILLW